MKENWVSSEKIMHAAENLRAAGEYPSINRVREFLGGRGSYSTISKTLKIWKENNPEEERAKYIAPAIPETVDAMLRDRLSETWRASYIEAQKSFMPRELDFIKQIQMLEQLLGEERRYNEKLDAKLNACTEEIGALKHQLEQLTVAKSVPKSASSDKKKEKPSDFDKDDLFTSGSITDNPEKQTTDTAPEEDVEP